LLNQHGQVLAVAEAVLVAVDTLAAVAVAAVSAASPAAALALRQLSTVVAFEQRQPSVATVHTLPVEVSADYIAPGPSTTVVIALLGEVSGA
jgi:hypothetical protein